jgi:hypothetical protein
MKSFRVSGNQNRFIWFGLKTKIPHFLEIKNKGARAHWFHPPEEAHKIV